MGVHGEGTKDLRSDGRLRVTVTWTDGRRVYRHIPARIVRKDQKAAWKEAERIRRELVEARDGGLNPSAQTLAVWLRSWLESQRNATRQRIRPRTLRGYEAIAEQSIIPALGGIRLDRLNERQIQGFIDAHPGAPQTVANHRALLRRVLNVAVRSRLLATNPALGVELPESEWSGGQPLSVEEGRRLLERSDERMVSLWRLALDTGLRQGELLGLGWADLDLEAGTVTVTAQLQRQNGEWVRLPTKAARSLQQIAIAPTTVAALRDHQLRQAAERQPDWAYWGHVFLKPNGQPYHGAEVLRAFHAACDEAGIPRRRFHDLRASTATIMRELGVAEDTRQARLGHSTTAMSRHYAKASQAQDRAAADLLGEALR